MGNQRKLILDQLERKLKPFRGLEKIVIPPQGWINNIRVALNMTLEQLGARLKLTKQGVKNIEERESSGSITIKALKEVAKALDMDFVYGFVPQNGSLENLIDTKARKLASKIVLRTHQNMKLEDQATSEERIKQAIEELTTEIKREMKSSLWDLN